MIKVRYALFCDVASRTDNSKAILHGIFDKLFAKETPTPEKPAIHPSMCFAYEVTNVVFKEKNEVSFVLVHEPTNDVVANLPLPINKFDPSSPHLGGVITLVMTRLVGLGKYVGRISLNGEVIAAGDFFVEKQG